MFVLIIKLFLSQKVLSKFFQYKKQKYKKIVAVKNCSEKMSGFENFRPGLRYVTDFNLKFHPHSDFENDTQSVKNSTPQNYHFIKLPKRHTHC